MVNLIKKNFENLKFLLEVVKAQVQGSDGSRLTCQICPPGGPSESLPRARWPSQTAPHGTPSGSQTPAPTEGCASASATARHTISTASLKAQGQ